jgi:hypothetical protein
MPRPPLEPPRLRRRAPARAARAAVVALVASCGLLGAACRGNDDPGPPPRESGGATTAAPVQTAPPEPAVVVAQAQPAPRTDRQAQPAPGADRQAQPASPPDSTPKSSGSLADVEARLDQMLKSAQACAGPDECRTVPVGGKACGGPTGYRAYSAKGADPQAVEALAREEHELAMAAARDSGRVSNCMILADPGARCVQNTCVTGGPQAPRGAATR